MLNRKRVQPGGLAGLAGRAYNDAHRDAPPSRL